MGRSSQVTSSIHGFVVVVVLACAGSAAAEPWVVVPVVVGSDESAQLAASRAAAPLAEALEQKTRVLAPAIARERFETRASSPPMAATHTDLDQIARDAQLALYHVAMGLYTSASTDVERVMSRADRALESLNRETLAARQLLDSCLFIVRARLNERKPQAARTQALECRRLVPDIEPDASMHPPDVIGELAAAEAQLESQEPGSLRVTSAPSGCPVFVQGRNLGQTPLELPRLSRGEYRVQVECVPGQYGRVHRVTLGPSRSVVHVDSHFDAVVQSSDGVSLVYSNQDAAQRDARAHALEVGRAVGARQVALITPEPGANDRVRIVALEVQNGQLLATVLVPLDSAGALGHANEAVAALTDGHSLDLTAEAPVALPVEEAAPVVPVHAAEPAQLAAATTAPLEESDPVPADEVSSAPSAAAWVLGGAGAATLVTGFVLYVHLLELDSDYRKVRELSDTSEAQRRLERIDSFELWPPVIALSGAALTTAALPLLLPQAPPHQAPTWALVTGGAGLATAAVGTYFLVAAGDCELDRFARCDEVASVTRLGAMLISVGAPLLAVPIVYWVRGDSGGTEDFAVTLEASPRAFGLQWRGKL
jgi:hypothetical protein